MKLPPHSCALRQWPLRLGCALLLGILAFGCDSNDHAPTSPWATGDWQDLGLSTDFVEVDALTTWNGYLIAGGVFHQVQGYPATVLASTPSRSTTGISSRAVTSLPGVVRARTESRGGSRSL
jgi:hypothetical protein